LGNFSKSPEAFFLKNKKQKQQKLKLHAYYSKHAQGVDNITYVLIQKIN